MRNSKLTCGDVLAYQLSYTSKNITKQNASSNVNYDAKKSPEKIATRTAYHEQSKKYKTSFYETVLKDLNIFYNAFTQNTKNTKKY